MRVYVAGPLTAPTTAERKANVQAAIVAGIQLLEAGHEPFVPHLNDQLEEVSTTLGITFSYEDWMRMDLAWLAQAEAMVFLGSSPGANREWDFAGQHGIKRFTSVKSFLAWADRR